jgi:hypothetical protein
MRKGKYIEYPLTPRGKGLVKILIAMATRIKGGEIDNG